MTIDETSVSAAGSAAEQPENEQQAAQNPGTGDVLMDYEKLASEQGQPGNTENARPHIGLAGGQGRDDPDGLDVSHYEGETSDSSTQIDTPEAPYRSGPGNPDDGEN